MSTHDSPNSPNPHDNPRLSGARTEAEIEDNRPDMPPLPASQRLDIHWHLNAAQTAFVYAPARFSFYVGGIGAGKTTAGALRALRWATKHPGSLGLIGAPTYPMLHDTTERAFLENVPPSFIAAYRRAAGQLVFTNGAEILFRSLDVPDAVRGLNLAWFWLDEAPLAGYYAWKVLKGRLRQRGQPTAAWATGTPHGRDGFWRDFEGKPRRGHVLFRASTHDNALNLPPDFIADLGYSGAFALQEIEGLFVAFEGLVYTFDASLQGHLRDPRPDTVWSDVIGGIDWGYANPTAALVFGLDGDGRAWQLDEFYQRRAGLEDIVLPAVLDLTRRYAVRRWYCGPDEPEHITALGAALAREGLPAIALKADNAVRAGIQTVTGLLALRPDGTRGLYISPRCVHTIAEYGTYQYAVASTSPSRESSAGEETASEQPIKANDHCFAAGTQITTALGNQPIEAITTGTLVLTPAGWRPVVAAGMTNSSADIIEVELSNGRALKGTANHPIFTHERGFVPLYTLQPGDILAPIELWTKERMGLCDDTSVIMPRPWYTRESCSGATLLRGGGQSACITCRRRCIVNREWDDYIKKSGRTHTGRYHQGMRFIIEMGIHSITRSTIWTVYQPKSIESITSRCTHLRNYRNGVSGSIAFALGQATGIALRMEGHGIASWANSRGRVVRDGRLHVITAEESIDLAPLVNTAGFVLTSVSLLSDVQVGETTLLSPAPSAVQCLSGTGTRKPCFAPVHVLRVRNTGRLAPVYNLTVAETPEYFAEGVLVHNCMDATRYALHTHFSQARATTAYLDALLRRANRERDHQ